MKKGDSENSHLGGRLMAGYIDLLSALLAPTIAVLGIIFTVLQWRTSEKSRLNALFDRRYACYMRIREVYLSQHDQTKAQLDTEDWIPFAEEAGFIFGDDIRAHVVGLADKQISSSPFFPDASFVKPFEKYLKL
ncbi:MAG: hypothetical protein SF051_10215 [Elusimicrobiota bacterium]|nr:hypothetical protein [Elusimicrobiota bacterium]